MCLQSKITTWLCKHLHISVKAYRHHECHTQTTHDISLGQFQNVSRNELRLGRWFEPKKNDVSNRFTPETFGLYSFCTKHHLHHKILTPKPVTP